MEKQTNKYKYAQLERFKEFLELGHIKRKTLIVNIIISILIVILVSFGLINDIEMKLINPTAFVLGIILIVNITFYYVENDLYNNLKLSMYATILGLYIATDILIFYFKTPSIFTVLFLTYAVISIYQDLKAMILSSSLLFLSGFLLITEFPDIFATSQGSISEVIYVQIFLLIFVLLLTLSSYILIKRKTFFYNQLATIKEAEIRNIELMEEVIALNTKEKKDFKEYYQAIELFNEKLSEKIGVSNLLGRKIEILKDLKTKKPLELEKKYPDYTLEELQELELLEFETHKKMQYLSIKASKSKDINVSKKEIFSESQFKSFKHINDSRYTQIISFVVFYTLLKIDKPYLKKIDEAQLKDILYNSEFYYRIDEDIINLYLNNSDVFETIINDYLKGGW